MRTNRIQANGKCECGCGADVKRRFVPGHDAQLKSRLVNTVNTTNAWWERERAARALLDRGWANFANPVAMAKVPVRSRWHGRFVETRNMAAVGIWVTDQAEVSHSHSGCPAIEGHTTIESSRSGWACSTCSHHQEVSDTVGMTQIFKSAGMG